MGEIDTIYHNLKESKKYRYLCDDTLHRISQWAAKRFKPKKAVKAARKKLHQVYGAYFEKMNIGKIQERLDEESGEGDIEELKRIALDIMESHISACERLPFIGEFYADLFDRIGQPKSIVDLACGLNPLTVPWMNLDPGSHYHAVDIDTRLISLLNRFLGYLSPRCRARCADILVALPEIEADTVFLLKTLPCLEQQEKGVSDRLLNSLEAKYIVVSFPCQTIGGQAKGMNQYYDTFARQLFTRLGVDFFKLEYPSEIFYVIHR
jgi:16S rRNA (guanine(1405)-N(7))-methyltransferase